MENENPYFPNPNNPNPNDKDKNNQENNNSNQNPNLNNPDQHNQNPGQNYFNPYANQQNQNPNQLGGGNYTNPNQQNYNNPYQNQFGNQQYGNQLGGQVTVPNSTAVLVLGIVSLLGWICYGIVGIICAIIALVLAKKGTEEYNTNPAMYSPNSYNNLKAGRVCAIIGLCLGILYIVVIVGFLLTAATAAGRLFRF
jgi:hypothetical protein